MLSEIEQPKAERRSVHRARLVAFRSDRRDPPDRAVSRLPSEAGSG
jgi:hypothetical protein